MTKERKIVCNGEKILMVALMYFGEVSVLDFNCEKCADRKVHICEGKELKTLSEVMECMGKKDIEFFTNEPFKVRQEYRKIFNSWCRFSGVVFGRG